MKTRSQTKKEKEQFKEIVIVGDAGVGKTNLINKLNKQKFERRYICTEKLEKITHEHKIIYDFPGQVKFSNYGSNILKNVTLCIIMYDTTNTLSYKALKFWIDKIESYCDNPEIIIVGNKIDLINNNSSMTENPYLYEDYIYIARESLIYIKGKPGKMSNNIYQHIKASVRKDININTIFEKF